MHKLVVIFPAVLETVIVTTEDKLQDTLAEWGFEDGDYDIEVSDNGFVSFEPTIRLKYN